MEGFKVKVRKIPDITVRIGSLLILIKCSEPGTEQSGIQQ